MHQDGAAMPSHKLNWIWPGNHRRQQNSSACRWTSSSVRTSPRQTRGGSSSTKWWRHWRSTHIRSCGTEPAPWIFRTCSSCDCVVCSLQLIGPRRANGRWLHHRTLVDRRSDPLGIHLADTVLCSVVARDSCAGAVLALLKEYAHRKHQ